MSSSPPPTTKPVRDFRDIASVLATWLLLALMGWGAVQLIFVRNNDESEAPSEPKMFPEIQLTLLAPPEPEPEPLPEPELVMESPPEIPPELEIIPPPEPLHEIPPEVPPAPPPEIAEPEPEPEPAATSERDDAIRAEWLTQLRQRIEASKFYPGMARYSREMGTVRLLIEIGPTGEIGTIQILENTGTPKLAQGALEIMRRAAETPLGTHTLPAAIQVEIPIRYRIERR